MQAGDFLGKQADGREQEQRETLDPGISECLVHCRACASHLLKCAHFRAEPSIAG